MTSRLKWFGVLFAFIAMTPVDAIAQPHWRVGVLADDLPFSRVTATDGDRVSHGLYIDWWRAIGKATGHVIDFVPCADHETCLTQLKGGNVDFVGPAPFTADAAVKHTRPVNRRYTFAISTSRYAVRTPLDLHGVKLGLLADAQRERDAVMSWAPSSIEVLSTTEAQHRLDTGAIDAVIADHLIGVDLPRDEDRQPLWFRWQHIYARVANEASLNRVDQAIDELEPSSVRIEGVNLPVGADALLLPKDARPNVERDVLAFIAEHPTVRLGASNWPPLTTYEDEYFDGLALRIVRYHLRRAGVTPVFVGDSDWRAVRERARVGEYDGIGYILVRSKSKFAPLIFTEPMIDVPMVVIARSEAGFWAKLDDLAGKQLVGNSDYGELAALLSGGRIKRLIETSNPAQALQMVQSGEVDAWLEYLPIAQSFIEAAGATDVKLAFRLGGPRGARTALRPEWAPIVPLIDTSIRQTTREDLASIYEHWNTRLHTTSTDHWSDTLVLLLSILFAVAIVVLAHRLWREHRTVRRRERSLRRAQRLTATGSVELRAPFDKVELEGETSSILGISPSVEVQGIDAHIALFNDGENIRKGISEARNADAPVRFDVHVDGPSPQVYAYELSPLQMIDGQEVMVGTIRNVTNERARLAHERGLEQQVLHLQKQDAIGRLAGGIAHDFNNMLAASIGYTELAMRELPKSHRAYKYMTQVLSASDRSRSLIAQILTFARHDTGNFRRVRWDACVEEAVSLMRASTPASTQLIVKLSGAPIWVYGDPTQLTQVSVNLMANAVDAIHPDGTVTIKLEPDDAVAMAPCEGSPPPSGLARLTVTDSGPGIDPAIRDQIFDPFFTTKPRGKGTGLGLSIVLGLVRAHKGTIEAQSGQDGGACFEVVLPTVAPARKTEAISKAPAAGSGQSLLVVDDEPALVEMYQQVLKIHGYRVTAVTSPTEGLRLISSAALPFDLLLTDLTMPELSGVRLAEEAKRLQPDLPILLLTGYRADAPEGSDGLFVDVLQKPLNTDQLVQSVVRALDHSHNNNHSSPSPA